ncbi:MAG TPA: NAD(P)-dependent oxidoreductase, partial [Chthoniobacterales bacterium]
MAAKLCFISTEPAEEEFFAERLKPWKPVFASGLEDVPEDTVALSIFIDDAIDEEFLACHPSLQMIATRSSGVDHIDMGACERRGVLVTSVSGFDGNSVAEHTIALLLAVARRLRPSGESRSRGRFSHGALRGFELKGRTLGLIGVGRIGSRVAELARAFGMDVIACDPKPNETLAQGGLVRYLSFDEVLGQADVLSLHAPLNGSTRHMLDAAALAKCKDGVVIINTARGSLIDTPALVQAIESGKVGGVGLDVLEDERVLRADAKRILTGEIAERVHRTERKSEPVRGLERRRQIERLFFNDSLLARPEVVFTPHIAFNTDEAVDTLASATAANIEDFLMKLKKA